MSGRLGLGQQGRGLGNAVIDLPQLAFQERPHDPVMADQNQTNPSTPAQSEKALEAVWGEQVGAQQGQVGDRGGQNPGRGDRPGRSRVEVAVAGQGDGRAQGGKDVVSERDRGVGARSRMDGETPVLRSVGGQGSPGVDHVVVRVQDHRHRRRIRAVQHFRPSTTRPQPGPTNCASRSST